MPSPFSFLLISSSATRLARLGWRGGRVLREEVSRGPWGSHSVRPAPSSHPLNDEPHLQSFDRHLIRPSKSSVTIGATQARGPEPAQLAARSVQSLNALQAGLCLQSGDRARAQSGDEQPAARGTGCWRGRSKHSEPARLISAARAASHVRRDASRKRREGGAQPGIGWKAGYDSFDAGTQTRTRTGLRLRLRLRQCGVVGQRVYVIEGMNEVRRYIEKSVRGAKAGP